MPDEIITDLTQIQRITVAKEHENGEFRTFIKLEVELSDRRLNTLVSETTSEVWKHIDCRSCANCCRTRQPVFSRTEAQRIAAYLGISLEELRARWSVARTWTPAMNPARRDQMYRFWQKAVSRSLDWLD